MPLLYTRTWMLRRKKTAGSAEEHTGLTGGGISLKVVKTIAGYLALCALSMTTYSFGPSLASLELLFDTDVGTLGISIMCTNIGYLLGAIAAAILVNRVPQELLYGMCHILSGLSLGCAPWPEDVYFYSAAIFIRGIFAGVVDAGVQSYTVIMWTGSRYRGPILQGLHCIFFSGVFIGPLLIRPFLTDVSQPPCRVDVQTNDSSYSNTTIIYETNTRSDELYDKSECDPSIIKMGYLTLGCVLLASGSFLVGLFLFEKFQPKKSLDAEARCDGDVETSVEKADPPIFRRQMLAIHFVLMVCWNCLWEVLAAMCAVFVLKELGWDTTRAALITSCLGIAAVAGLILAVPLSALLSPRQMLLIGVSIATVSVGVMASFVHSSNAVMWVTMAFTGAAGSGVDASATLYLASHVKFDGVASAIGMLGMSMAAVIGIPVTAALFEKVSYMWVLYIPLIGGILSLITIGLWLLVVYLHSRQKEDNKSSPEGDELNPKVIENNLEDAIKETSA